MKVSGYRCVWIMVMFDLPVDSKKARREYTRFRKNLLEDGFNKMQFSIYLRHCASPENAEVHTKRVKRWIPPLGEVRTLVITDKQFERMEVYYGKRKKNPEKPLLQLELF